MRPIIVWGGVSVLAAYMTYREIKELNKKNIDELRDEITPEKVAEETIKMLGKK